MKYLKGGYLINFIKSQISIFSRPKDDYMIPKNMFDEKIYLHLKVPYCPRNETMIFKVINNIEEFTSFRVKVNFSWITNQTRSLFPLKDKISHHHSVIYKDTYSCSKTFIGETLKNAVVRWKEHEYHQGKSEPAKHLLENPAHSFCWEILDKASLDIRKRKILEAYYIKIFSPSLNDQIDIRKLTLLRNGLT